METVRQPDQENEKFQKVLFFVLIFELYLETQ